MTTPQDPYRPPSEPPSPWGAAPSYGATPPAGPTGSRNGAGAAALGLGILSLLLFWIPVLDLLLAVLAVALGIAGVRRASRREASNRGVAIGGLVTGCLGLLLAVAVTAALSLVFQNVRDYRDCMDSANTIAEQHVCRDQLDRAVRHRFGTG